MVFWHQTQHMQAIQLRDTISLGSLSLMLTPQAPLSLPFHPLHLFLEALPHTTLGRAGGITWGVYLCMSEPCICVCTSERASKRKINFPRHFCLNVTFKQHWVEHSRHNPSVSFSEFSLLIQLLAKPQKYVIRDTV